MKKQPAESAEKLEKLTIYYKKVIAIIARKV